MWIKVEPDDSLNDDMRLDIDIACRKDAVSALEPALETCYVVTPSDLPNRSELMTLTFMTLSSLTALLKVWLSGKRRRITIKRGDTSVAFDGPDFEAEANAVAKVLAKLNRGQGALNVSTTEDVAVKDTLPQAMKKDAGAVTRTRKAKRK